MADEPKETSLDELMQTLSGVDPDEFAKALHRTHGSLYQRIFNDGHKAASGKLGKESESLTQKIQALEDERAALETKISELSEGQPDAEKIRAKYEEALRQKDQQIKAKETEWEQKYSGLKTSIVEEKLGRIKTEAASFLSGKVIDPEYARIRTNDPDLIKRLEFTDDGVTFYQKDGMTPYSIPEGESIAALIAREIEPTIPKPLLKNAKPTHRLDGIPGGQTNGTVKKSSFSRAEKAEFFQRMREEGKNPAEEWDKLSD